ncbi:MAG: NMD3-related protein [Candidatus Aenigmatarchaeota archaeon]
MRNKFCPICGKQASHEGYCEGHWNERNPLITLPERLSFVQCPKCGLVKERGRWVMPDFEKIIKGSAKIHGEVDQWMFTPKGDEMRVEVHGWIKGHRKKDVHAVKLKAVKNICPVCGKLLGGYYEAKLQVRGDYHGGILERIEKEAERIGKADRKAFFRSELVKGGVDYFFGSKAAAKQVAEGLRRNFGAELTTSFQIAGRKGGKELRRTIIAARF